MTNAPQPGHAQPQTVSPDSHGALPLPAWTYRWRRTLYHTELQSLELACLPAVENKLSCIESRVSKLTNELKIACDRGHALENSC